MRSSCVRQYSAYTELGSIAEAMSVGDSLPAELGSAVKAERWAAQVASACENGTLPYPQRNVRTRKEGMQRCLNPIFPHISRVIWRDVLLPRKRVIAPPVGCWVRVSDDEEFLWA